ncbi:MAG: chorismate synthase [Bacillota bacterium]
MSSSFGHTIKITLFGQSHSEAIGVVIDGLPAGEPVDLALVEAFLARRAPGQNALSTPRREKDKPIILSGLVDGHTCGAPLCAIIENKDARPADYAALSNLPRPSHADYPAFIKHRGQNDIRGGGHFSARLTAPLCFAGAVCKQLLERRGVVVGAHILSVGQAFDAPFDPVNVSADELSAISERRLPVLDEAALPAIEEEILAASKELDSVGGTVECCAIGLPVGLGEPMFDGIENRLAAALFGIPAVRGVEFGAGFRAAEMRGSAHNDPYCVRDGRVETATNHHGGVLGGLTTGMPLLLCAAFKPTPSIPREQRTVDLVLLSEQSLAIRGRHDPCVVVRAVPVVEAVTAAVLLDFII